MRPRHPERLKNFSYLGYHRYFLTFCTHNRTPVFTTHPPVDLVRAQISRAALECCFAVPAYCFMPDHLHVLIEGKAPASDGRGLIKRAKQYSGFHYSRQYGFRLWQRYGYEHVIRDGEKTAAVARYILQNPVRAGLTARIEDYPFVGSLEWPLAALLDWISRD